MGSKGCFDTISKQLEDTKVKIEAAYRRIDNTMNKEGQAMIYKILY